MGMKALHDAYRHHEQALEGKGFAVTAEPGLDGWWQALGRVSDANPAFRPQPDVTARNSLWLRLTGESGITAGGIALRVYDGLLSEWLASGRLWMDVPSALSNGPVEAPLPEGFPDPERFFQTGGLVVFSEFQGHRLSHHLVHMMRCAGFLNYGCEHNIGIQLKKLGDIATRYYDYARVAPVCEGRICGEERAAFISHIDREEYLAELEGQAAA